MIPNSPITKAYILHAEDIFVKNVGYLKGKNTRKKLEQFIINNEDLPEGLLERHGNMTLETYTMYIKRLLRSNFKRHTFWQS